jgi:two-component system sensor histidine kinase CpxA
MKVPFPLSFKVSLLLLANLLMLAAVGGGLYVSQFGIGWTSLTRGALGDQLQGIVDSIQSDLQDEPRDTWSEILVPRSQKYNADFFIFTNEGTQISGEEVRLPPAVRLELLRAEGTGDPHPNNPRPARPPPPRHEALPENRRPPGIFPPPEEGKFVVRSQKPAAFWIGLRLPIPTPQGRHIPGTLLIRADSVWTLVGLVRIGPWLSIAAGVMALSLLFWLPLVRSITRCLKSLTGATERIAEGEFTTRIYLARRDELGHLGHSVNRMAERLDTLVNGQKRFLGDVAHELGSPLGRLQVATEILESRADLALQPHIVDVREEVQHMAMLVNELLAFTKAGLRPRDAQLATITLAPLVQRVLAREDQNQRVSITLDPSLTVLADAELLERALANLIRNARRYAPSGPITLTARTFDGTVKLNLSDEGPGVPSEALNRLGEPFYRPDAARSNEAGGTGLGLAIVRAALIACQGTATFQNRNPNGFIAELTLRVG